MNAAHLCYKAASVSVNKSLNREPEEMCSCILTFFGLDKYVYFYFDRRCCHRQRLLLLSCCVGGLTLQVSDGFGCGRVASESFEVNAERYLLPASCWLLVVFCEATQGRVTG